MEGIALILFICIFLLILFGFPVAFTLGGLSVLFGYFTLEPEFFNFLPSRIMGTVRNTVLIAVPLFIYMGIMLEKSGLAESLLETMAMLFGKVKATGNPNKISINMQIKRMSAMPSIIWISLKL